MSQRIVGRTVAVENINEGNKRKLATFNLVSRCDYVEGNDFLIASLNTQAKDWLLELKGNFTQSSVKELLKLNSYYSLRMYNWLMQTSKFSSGRIMKIEDIKYMVTDPNNAKTIYPEFRDFEKRILKKAQDELENTDMAFTYRKIKEGKSVAKIHFKLKKHQEQDGDPAQIPLQELRKDV